MSRPPRPIPTRAEGAYGFSIHVSRAGRGGRDSAVSVERPLESFGLTGMVLRSSSRQVPLIPAERWPEGTDRSIVDRLRRDGAIKGRVLAIWQGDQVVAVCSWHLDDSGPPVIFDLVARDDLSPLIAGLARSVLMLCLRDIAGAQGLRRDTSSLRWTDLALEHIAPDTRVRSRLRGALRARATALQFEPLRPHPKWLKGTWAGERQF